MRVRSETNWDPKHTYIVLRERIDLLRIIGQQAHRPDVQVTQDLDSILICSQIGRESKLAVRGNGVQPAVLQGVCLNLVEQTDSAALLAEIDDDSDTLGLDVLQSRFELLSTITSQTSYESWC